MAHAGPIYPLLFRRDLSTGVLHKFGFPKTFHFIGGGIVVWDGMASQFYTMDPFDCIRVTDEHDALQYWWCGPTTASIGDFSPYFRVDGSQDDEGWMNIFCDIYGPGGVVMSGICTPNTFGEGYGFVAGVEMSKITYVNTAFWGGDVTFFGVRAAYKGW